MKSISINRGGYFFILFIFVVSIGIWKAESYSVKRRIRDKRVLLPYGQDRISSSSSQSNSPTHETYHRVTKRSPIMEWYYPYEARLAHPNFDASTVTNTDGSPATYYIPPQDHANMLAEVQRFADHQLLPKGFFPDSSQYPNGEQSSQIPAGFQEQLTFLHTDSSHHDQTASADVTKLALLEQVKHLTNALTEGRAVSGNGIDTVRTCFSETNPSLCTDLLETGLSQDDNVNPDEWTDQLQSRGKDQGHPNQKIIKSSQSHLPEELTNLNDPFLALFLSQLDHQQNTLQSGSKTKPGHVESIQLGNNGQYSSQLSTTVSISPYDPVVLDKDDPFLNLLLHKKDSYYSVPSSPSLSSLDNYPTTNTEDYDAYDPTDNFEYQTTTPSPPSSAKQFLNPYSHQSHSHSPPTSTLHRPPKSQNSLDSLSINYPTTTSTTTKIAPTLPYDDTIGYDEDNDYLYPPLGEDEVAHTQNPYPIYKYEPASSVQKQTSDSSSQLKDRLQDFIDDSYTLPPPQAYDIPYQVQYPIPDEEEDDSTTSSSYLQESAPNDSYDDTDLSSPASEYPFLDPITEKPYPLLSPYSNKQSPIKPGDKHPSEYSVTENPTFPDEATSGYNYDDEENIAPYPTQSPVAYSDLVTSTDKYSDQPSLQSKYYPSSTYKDIGQEKTQSPVFSGSLTSYPTKTLVPYPSATTTPKPTTTTTTTTTLKPTQIYDTSTASYPGPLSLNKHTKPLYVSALQKALALQQMLRRDHRPTPSTNFYTNYQPDYQQYPRTHLTQDPILGRAEDGHQQKPAVVQPNLSDIDIAHYHLAQFYAQQRQPHWEQYYTVPEIQTYAPHPQYIYHQQGVPKLIRSARKTSPNPKPPVFNHNRRFQLHHHHNRPLTNSKVNYWILNTMNKGDQLFENEADRILSRTHRLRKRSLPPPRESHHRPAAEEKTRFLVYSPKYKVDKRKVSYWVRWQAGFWPDPLNIQPVSELPDIFSDFKVDKKTNLDLIKIDDDETEAEQLLKPRRSLSKRSLKQNGSNYSENALIKRLNSAGRIRIQKLISLDDSEKVNHISTSGVTFDERDDSKYQHNYKKRNNLSILEKRTKGQSPKKVKSTNFFKKYNISISPKYEDVEIGEDATPITTTKRPQKSDTSNIYHRFRPRITSTTRTTTLKPTRMRFLPAKETEVHTDESPTSFVYMGSHNLILPGLYSDETNIT